MMEGEKPIDEPASCMFIYCIRQVHRIAVCILLFFLFFKFFLPVFKLTQPEGKTHQEVKMDGIRYLLELSFTLKFKASH